MAVGATVRSQTKTEAVLSTPQLADQLYFPFTVDGGRWSGSIGQAVPLLQGRPNTKQPENLTSGAAKRLEPVPTQVSSI